MINEEEDQKKQVKSKNQDDEIKQPIKATINEHGELDIDFDNLRTEMRIKEKEAKAKKIVSAKMKEAEEASK